MKRNMTFRVPFEARVKVAELCDYGYRAQREGIAPDKAFRRLLNGLLALDSMLDRIDAEWWDAQDQMAELRREES